MPKDKMSMPMNKLLNAHGDFGENLEERCKVI